MKRDLNIYDAPPDIQLSIELAEQVDNIACHLASQLTRDYMQKQGADYVTAMHAVLDADPELEERYAHGATTIKRP